MINRTLFTLLFFLSVHFLSAQNAEQILKERGEVYFSFQLDTDKDLAEQVKTIGRIISIDNIKGDKVYAYANAKGFAQFSQFDYNITVLTAPSMLLSRAQLEGGSRTNWDYYPNYNEYINILNQFATDYPSLCEVVNIGSTEEGRDLLFIHINDSLGIDQAEPEFMYTSSMHGDEITGYVLMLHLIEYMLENYGTDDRITNMVNSIDIWINPMANPDGTFYGGNNSVFGAIRYNANIVDLNRNYPDPEDGPHPDGEAYQAETRAFMDFADSREFTMAANFHGGVEVINYPWDTWPKLAADDDWWVYVCRQYADTTQANSPFGYFTDLDNGITNGYQWYEVAGGRQDYMNYEQHCREVTIELSETKLPPPNQLPDFWEYNYRSLIDYMEQSLFGLRGIITDAQGEPVYAEVSIEGHDKDQSQVYSSPIRGNYHRYLDDGIYSVTYRADGYEPIIVNNVRVTSDSTTYVDVQFDSLVGFEDEEEFSVEVYPNPAKDIINIQLPRPAGEVLVMNMQGSTVLHLIPSSNRFQIEMGSLSKGIYLINISFENRTVQKKIVLF